MKRWEMGWGWKSMRETGGGNPVRLPLIVMTFIFQFTPLSEARVPTYLEFPSGVSVVTRSFFLFPCLCITGPSSPSALLRYNWHKTFLWKLKVYTVEIWDTYCKIFTTVTVNTAITSHSYHFVVVIHYRFCITSPSVHVLLFEADSLSGLWEHSWSVDAFSILIYWFVYSCINITIFQLLIDTR